MTGGRIIGIGLSILLLSVIASAQQGSYTKLNPNKGQKAYSAPISDRTIVFEVIYPDGHTAVLTTQEGSMAKFGNLAEGDAFALVPRIKDVDRRTAVFDIFRLTADEEGNESIVQVQKLEVGSASVSTETKPPFQLRTVSIESLGSHSTLRQSGEPKLVSAAARSCKPASGTGARSDQDCCMQCDVIWACGLCVRMYCGCCCDPPLQCDVRPTT